MVCMIEAEIGTGVFQAKFNRPCIHFDQSIVVKKEMISKNCSFQHDSLVSSMQVSFAQKQNHCVGSDYTQ